MTIHNNDNLFLSGSGLCLNRDGSQCAGCWSENEKKCLRTETFVYERCQRLLFRGFTWCPGILNVIVAYFLKITLLIDTVTGPIK